MADNNKNSVKYKYGQNEFSLEDYITNIGNNVQSYLEDRRQRGWTDALVQEFSTAYNRYINAFKQQLAEGNNRFSTNDLGHILDSKGEFSDTDNDDNNGNQYYYNDKGERITNIEYNNLKEKKQKKFGTFEANKLVAEYFRVIGNAMKDKMESSKSIAKEGSDNIFDIKKHGFVNWWNNKYDPTGTGLNWQPFLDVDAIGEDGQRNVVNRPEKAAEWVKEYLDWVDSKKFNFGDLNEEEFRKSGENLLTKLNDGTWNNEDLISAAQFGMTKDWTDKYFSTEGNPFATKEDEQLAAAAKAAAEEEEARNKWAALLWETYSKNPGQYYDEAETDDVKKRRGTKYMIQDFKDYFNPETGEVLTTDKLVDYYNRPGFLNALNRFVQNPFNSVKKEDVAPFLAAIVNNGGANLIQDGKYAGWYYINSTSDYKLGRALIFNPLNGEMFYTYAKNVPDMYSMLLDRYLYENTSYDPFDDYRKFEKGGTILMQLGGEFNKNYESSRDNYVESVAKSLGLSKDEFLGKRRKLFGEKGEVDKENGKLSVGDIAHLVSTGLAVGSIIASLTGVGAPVSAGLGASSSLSQFVGDIADDGIQWGDVANFGVGLGLDAISLVPEAGAFSQSAKILKNISRVAKTVTPIAVIALGAAGAKPIIDSMSKLLKDGFSAMTADDWQNMLHGINLALGIGGAGARSLVNARKAAPVKLFGKTIEGVGIGDANFNAKTFKNRAIKLRRNDGEIEAIQVKKPVAEKILNAKTNEEISKILQEEGVADMSRYSLVPDKSTLKGKLTVKGEKWYQKRPTWEKGDKKVQLLDVERDVKTGEFYAAAKRNKLGYARELDIPLSKQTSEYAAIDAAGKSELGAIAKGFKNPVKIGTASERVASIRKAAEEALKSLRPSTAQPAQTHSEIKAEMANIVGEGAFKFRSKQSIDKAIETHTKALERLNKNPKGNYIKIQEVQRKLDGAKQAKARLEELERGNDWYQNNKYQEYIRKADLFLDKLTNDNKIQLDNPNKVNDKITLDIKSVLDRLGIVSKRNGGIIGKYQSGNAIRNVQNKDVDWYRDVFNNKIMQDWLRTFTSDEEGDNSYHVFNNLQESWWKNYNETGYNQDQPQNAVYSDSVKTRLEEWNKTPNNKIIGDLRTAGRLVGNGGTKDTPEGNYVDGYFGSQEFLRHGGTLFDIPEAKADYVVAELNKALIPKGLSYELDRSGKTPMYMLYKDESPESLNNPPQIDLTSVTQTIGDGSANNYKKLRSYMMDPKLMSLAAVFHANKVNDIMTDRSLAAARKSLALYDPKNVTKYLLGDFDSLMSGKLAAGKLRHIASEPITSDGALQLAAKHDAENKALDYEMLGRLTDNIQLRKSKDELWKILKDDADFNYDVAMKNRASLADLTDNIANILNAHDAKQYTNWDVLRQELLMDKMNKYKQYLTYALEDLENNLYNNPLSYGVQLTGDENRIWRLVQQGTLDLTTLNTQQENILASAQRKITAKLRLEAAKILGIPRSGYLVAPLDFQPRLIKDGSKLEIAKIRERSKNADRFQKNVKDKQDRVDKAIARVDKKMYSRRDPEKRRRK